MSWFSSHFSVSRLGTPKSHLGGMSLAAAGSPGSGNSSSESSAPCFIRGTGPVPPENDSAPLVVVGVIAKEASSPLFIDGVLSVSSACPLYVLGPDGSISTSVPLVLSGKDNVSSSSPLFVVSDSHVDAPSPLVTSGHVSQSSNGVTLVTLSRESGDNRVPLYLHNTDENPQSSSPLFINATSPGVYGLTASSPLYQYTAEGDNIKTLSIPLQIHGQGENKQLSLPLYVRGGGTEIAASAPMFIANNWAGSEGSAVLIVSGEGWSDGADVIRLRTNLFVRRNPGVYCPLFLKGDPEPILSSSDLVLLAAGVINKSVSLSIPNTVGTSQASTPLFARGF